MLSMLVAFFIVPGSLLGSLAATLVLVVALSVLVAVAAGPALLTLLGPNLDRWRIGPAAPDGRSRLMAVVAAALRRPGPGGDRDRGDRPRSSALPALGLKTGPAQPDAARPRRPGQEGPRTDRAGSRPRLRRPLRGRRRRRRRADHRTGAPARRSAAGSGRSPASPVCRRWSARRRSRARSAPLRQAGSLLAAGGGSGAAGRSWARWAATSAAPPPASPSCATGSAEASYGAGLLAEGSGRAEEGAAALASGLGAGERRQRTRGRRAAHLRRGHPAAGRRPAPGRARRPAAEVRAAEPRPQPAPQRAAPLAAAAEVAQRGCARRRCRGLQAAGRGSRSAAAGGAGSSWKR